ncbi:hypothetical protein GQ457_06G022400 [Hibiscus cannabinus]
MRPLLDYIRYLSRHIVEPWILLGDFNATITAEERRGCSSPPDREFVDVIFYSCLHDLGYQGPDFTWYKNNRSVRLDRCFCNEYWLESFADTVVHHLLRMKSDHMPLLVTIVNIPRICKRRFRYFAGWLQHGSFKELVRSNWNPSLPISATIELFCHAADSWNCTVFGSLSHRKRHIMARLRGSSVALIVGVMHSFLILRAPYNLSLSLSNFWTKRSFSGSRNPSLTGFLFLASGEWCDDDAIFHDEAVLFFRNLFTNDSEVRGTFPLSGHFSDLSAEEMQGLDLVPSMEEIKDSLFAMSPLKSPCSDGLDAHFFQQNWEIVGPSLITKILVRRLQPIMCKLIAPNQTSFLPGRNITENIIINQEIIHSMKSKSGQDGWMAVKIDLEKAFDRLRWDFISDTLFEAGLPPTITRLILHCISSSTMQVQFNSGLSSDFKP